METARSTTWRSNLVFLSLFGFAFGILVSSFVFIQPLVALLVIVVGVAIFVVDKKVIFLVLFIISFGLGSLRYAVKDFHELKTPDASGIVVSEPEDKENSRRFVYLSDNGEKVLVSAPLYTRVEYGDRVEVNGKLERPGMIEDFNYGAYLAKDDIYYTESNALVKVLESGQGNVIKSALLKFKRSFVEHIKAILPEPESGLLAGLIISGKDALPKDILEEFRRAGVIHIVVLSGFNITLIAEFIRRSLEKFIIFTKIKLMPQAAAGLSLLGIFLFVLMTGAEATVVRAAVMAGIVIAAKLFGRNYNASRALLFAGTLMLLENPKILVFDPSFQLSFLATLGLIYFMAPIERRLGWIKRDSIREILAQTLATQLTVLPLLIYSIGDVSLVSIPANLLILLIVPYVMLTGFVATLVSYLSAIIAWPITYLTHLMLSWILFVSQTLGNLSFATFKLPLPLWVTVLIYLLLLSLIIFRSRWRSWFPRFANLN